MAGLASGSDPALHAFLDESQLRSSDKSVYILGASICDVATAPAVRGQMMDLLLPRQVKLHWHDETKRRRKHIVHAVANLPVRHVVAVHEGRPREKAERQRRHCLERMLFELDLLDVAEAIFESRGSDGDRRDRDMVDALRARKVITARLRISHMPGPQDPLLWVPDVLCGTVARVVRGDVGYLDALTDRIRIVNVAAT